MADNDVKVFTTPKDKKKNTKRHVEVTPILHESRDAAKVTQLINALGESTDSTAFKHALTDPKGAVQNVAYRGAAGKLLEALLDVVFNDPTVFQKMRQELSKDVHEGIMADVVKDVADELLRKHLGVIGKALSLRTVKKPKKKKTP